MSSSSGGGTGRSFKTGFSDEEVTSFLQKGATLSRDSEDIVKPKEKARMTKTVNKKSTWKKMAGVGSDKMETTVSGFMGKFSSMGAEELDRLTTSFLQRQQNIKQRVAQPGRSGFLIQR